MATDSAHYDVIKEHFDSSAYEILEMIGKGGFGRVYRAQQANTGQIVAIKFLSVSSEYDDAKKKRYIERFERETQLCSRLQHPNIVRLLDKGRFDDDQLYAVFEYVEGKTLKQTLAESGTLTAIEAADIMGQVLDALVHAHAEGVIHRDIKPANIILTKTGAKTHAKVLDYGIGTLASEARHLDYKTLTLTQEALGTPSYSAPEQLRGEPPTVKTDLYVWALVFIECLIKQPAISGSNIASIFHKQLSTTNVPLPPAIIGHPVAALLRRALQKKVHERTVTAEELYHELNQLNFANLVGHLSSQDSNQGVDTNAYTLVAEQDTIIGTNAAAFTGLTERKQITVLAVCLQVRKIGNESLDTEVIDALHHDQKNQCADIAVRYGATHIGTLGDTLLFYFGYPNVSDNDPRLCARTALDIISSLSKRNSLLKDNQGIAMQARLGINTGVVTTYSDAAPEGDTPNTALELARFADVDHILCSDTSRKILEPYIEFEVGSGLTLGINAEQAPTFKLKGERQVEAFGFLRGTRRNEAFVGRDTELEQLIKLLNSDHSKDLTNFAHVHGEAGIGKSRLVFELRDKAKDHHHYVAQCLPEHQNNALYPILNLLKYKYSLDALNTEQVQNLLTKTVEKIDTANESNLSTALPILFTWLNISLSEGMEPSPLAPDLQKQHLFKILSALFKADLNALNNSSNTAEKNLYIFEDIHWADPTSVEYISQFVESLKDTNHVFISTSRQPLPEMLVNQGFNDIEVNKLSTEATTEFIVTLFDHHDISPNVLDILISRTDGIPLFIEELINMLQQKSLTHKLNGIIDFVNPDKLDEVPTNLRDSLQQKLDALVYSKETAQLAATIGREFDYDLLITASSYSEDQIQSDLNELVEAELIIQQRKVDGDSYIFKHALVRDAAYDSVVEVERICNHLQIAIAYEQDFSLKAKKQPWVVANHYANAKKILKASDWGLSHLNNLSHLSLNMEAVQIYEIMKGWFDKDSYSEDIYNLQIIMINSAIFSAYTKKFGWGYEKLKVLAEENLKLINLLKHSQKIDTSNLTKLKYKADWVLFAYNHYQGNRKEARRRGELIFKSEINQDSHKNKIMLRTMLGQAYFFDGDFDKASQLLKEVMSSYDIDKDINLNIEFGFDPYLMAAGNLMSIEVMTGRLNKGIEYRNLCLSHALKTKNKATIITGYTWGTCYFFLLNDKKGMHEWCKSARENSPNVFEGEWIQRYFNSNEDWYHSKVENGLQVIREDIESGQTGILSWYEPPVACSLITLGRYSEARELMYNSYTRSIECGDICVVAITLRELARAELECKGDKALEYYNLSLEFARKTGSKYLEAVIICNLFDAALVLDSGVKDSLKNNLKNLLKEIDYSGDYIWLNKSKKIIGAI